MDLDENKVVGADLQQGYDVYPVNPRGDQIEGLTVYKSLADVPVERLTRISVYLPPHIGLKTLDEVAAKGCDEFWLNPGRDREEVVARAGEVGLDPIIACSIVDVGVSPHQFGD